METSLQVITVLSSGDDAQGLDSNTARTASNLTRQVILRGVSNVGFLADGPGEDVVGDPCVTTAEPGIWINTDLRRCPTNSSRSRGSVKDKVGETSLAMGRGRQSAECKSGELDVHILISRIS